MPQSFKCQFCRRQLKNPMSIALGVGPECASKRIAFVSGCGTSDAEIASLSESGKPEVLNWIRNFHSAVSRKKKNLAIEAIKWARYNATRVEIVPVDIVI